MLFFDKPTIKARYGFRNYINVSMKGVHGEIGWDMMHCVIQYYAELKGLTVYEVLGELCEMERIKDEM